MKEVDIGAAAFSRGDAIPGWVEPVAIPTTARQNPVVLRLADSQLRAGETNVVFINRAIQVNDVSALAQIGQYQIHFVPQYQKLRLHRVLVLRGAEVIDQTASAGVRFLERETGLERGAYSGAITVSLLISDVRVGDTLNISYSIEGSNPVFGHKYAETAALDNVAPVELRNVVLSYPAERNIRWKIVGDYRKSTPSPESRIANGYRLLRWQEHSQDGINLESNIPQSYLPIRLLQFSEYENWNEVATWANSLFPPAGPLPAELKALISAWRQLPTDEQRVLRSLQWVQTEIRYFSVALGESSHRPFPPAEVVKRRFGDCKDKTYLLVSILRDMGIDARPVLLSLSAPKVPDRLMPSPEAFDHALVQVKVDGQFYYVDGTLMGQQGRLSELSSPPDGISGLVVAADSADLLTIRAVNGVEQNTSDLVEQFTIPDFGGTSTLASQSTWHGAAAESLRVIFRQLTREQLRKFVLGLYERRYPGIQLTGEPEIRDDTTRNSMTLMATYSVPKLAAEFSGNWGMKFFPHNFREIVVLPQQVTRTFPLAAMSYPSRLHYEISVRWPEDVAMMTDPTHEHVRSDFFDLDVAISFRGNQFNQRVTFQPKLDVVEANQVPTLLEDMKKFDTAIRGYVGVSRGSIKTSGVLGIGQANLQETIRKQMQSAIDRTSKTIAGGRLSGEDLAGAYCDRAEAYADLGKPADGLGDALEAVRLAPQSPRSWQCRGNIHFAMGEFSRAVADFSKALSLGAEEFHTYYRRGHARFYLGKLTEASDDFATAIKMATDESDQLYASLWQAWTLQRLNKPLPTDLVARATKDPLGPWPRPALAMLTSAVTPEQVLAEVNKKQGDDREMTLAEAYFYLGQYRRNRGQLAEAEDLFRMTRDKGITPYVEHVAAGFELRAAK